MTTTQQQGLNVPTEAPPFEGLTRFIGLGAWAAIASGLAMAVSLLMEWLVVPHERLGPEAFLTGSYHVSAGLRLLSIVLLVWGLIGIYGRHSRALGTFGLWTFVVAFLGTALTVGNAWAEVFVWPTLTEVDPNALLGTITGASPYLVAGLNVSFPLFGIGLILFEAVTFWAGALPRWASALLIVSVPVTIFLAPTPGSFQESIGQIMLGTAVAALGWYALRTPTLNR